MRVDTGRLCLVVQGVLAVGVSRGGSLFLATGAGTVVSVDSVELTTVSTALMPTGSVPTSLLCLAVLADGSVVTGGANAQGLVWRLGKNNS